MCASDVGLSKVSSLAPVLRPIARQEACVCVCVCGTVCMRVACILCPKRGIALRGNGVGDVGFPRWEHRETRGDFDPCAGVGSSWG